MGSVEVIVLGSGDAFGSGGRFQAAIFVDSKPGAFLLDCGATALIALKKQRIDPKSLGLILISHLHGDHIAGLPFFFLEYQFLTPREGPVLIAGPPGIRERIEGLFHLMYPDVTAMDRRFQVEYAELEAGQWTRLKNVGVLPIHVRHRPNSYGYKVRVEGKVIAYSGDTAWTEALVELADGADLFIAECSLYESRSEIHMSYPDFVANRGRLNCKRFLLTHLHAEMLEKLDQLTFEAAHDGMRLEV